MNKTLTKVLALVGGVAILGCAMLGGMQLWAPENVKPSNWGHVNELPDTGDNGDNMTEDNCAISITPVESSDLMTLRAVPYESSADDGIETLASSATSKNLVATVSTSLENPMLDWTVGRWDGTAVTEVTVTPVSDGAFTATVTCKQAFEGVIWVKAEIRDVGTYAYAQVIYTGIPTEISVLSSTMPMRSAKMYNATACDEYVFEIGLSNPFGKVNEKYNDFELVKVTKSGAFWAADLQTGGEWVSEDKYMSFATAPPPAGYSDLMRFSMEGNQLTVYVDVSLKDYCSETIVMSSAPSMKYLYKDHFKSYVTGICSYYVEIRENRSGLEFGFSVTWSDAMMSSVTFAPDDVIEF